MQVWCKTFILNVQFCKTIIRTEYIQYIYIRHQNILKVQQYMANSSALLLFLSIQALRKREKSIPGGPVKSNTMNIM